MRRQDILKVDKIASDNAWFVDVSVSLKSAITDRAVKSIGNFNNENMRNQYISLMSKMKLFLNSDRLVHPFVEWISGIVGDRSVVVVPIKRIDQNKPGSSHKYAYDAVAYGNIVGKKYYLQDINGALRSMKAGSEGLFVFVDDFTGTGDTAMGVVEALPSVEGDFLFYSAIAMEGAAKRIGALAPFYSHNVVQAAFGLGGGEQANYLELESEIEIGREYSMGYGQARALVGMLRTPNNTLPIFWASKKRGGGEWQPMLSR